MNEIEKIIEENKKLFPLLDTYIEKASPYPSIEEFCLLHKVDISDFKHWITLDKDLRAMVRKLHLKAYVNLERYLILDVKTISFGGNEGKEYKLDKAGLTAKLKELKEALEE